MVSVPATPPSPPSPLSEVVRTGDDLRMALALAEVAITRAELAGASPRAVAAMRKILLRLRNHQGESNG